MEIKTKFNRGDNVWFMHNNKPMRKPIIGIYISANEYDTLIQYEVKEIGDIFVMEEIIFETKEELIKSLK